jgi:putative ABC transport system permease protein
MGLGIGANTAVFSVVNAVLLKPLSHRDPDRIVTISDFTGGASASASPEQVSIPDLQDWHDKSSSFEPMAYYGSRESPVMAGATAEHAWATAVGPEYFRVFTVEPLVGRFFTPEGFKPGSDKAVMISYAYWQTHFGRSRRTRSFPENTVVAVFFCASEGYSLRNGCSAKLRSDLNDVFVLAAIEQA